MAGFQIGVLTGLNNHTLRMSQSSLQLQTTTPMLLIFPKMIHTAVNDSDIDVLKKHQRICKLRSMFCIDVMAV